MSAGPIVVAALERENAVAHWREVIGATDPKEAAPGTIRALYAESKGANLRVVSALFTLSPLDKYAGMLSDVPLPAPETKPPAANAGGPGGCCAAIIPI